MWHKKLFAAARAVVFSLSQAIAGSGTITVLDSTGTTKTYQIITNGSGNFVGMFGLCDGAAAAQCVAVKAASAAPLATDPAVVVSMSPNSNSSRETGGNLATLAGAVTSSVVQSNTKQVNGVTALAGAGATGTGSQRVTAAQDTTTIAGSAPGTAGSASSNVLSVQGIASMTPFLVNPGTAANWGVVAQASATSGQLGQLSLGAVTTAAPTYTSAQSDPLSLDTSGNLRVNCTTGCSASSSITGWAGGTLGAMANYGTSPGAVLVPGVNAFVTNTNANGQTAMSASSPVTIASDQSAVAVKAASGALASGSIASGAAVSGAFVAGAIADLAHGQGAASGSVPVVLASNQTAADPCMFQAKTNVPISTASGTAARGFRQKIYVCSLLLIAPSAVSVSLAEGSSATCGTSSQAAVIGVATSGTAANGLPLAANSGLTLGSGGGTIAATSTAGNYLCLFQSETAQIAGNLTYVQQ